LADARWKISLFDLCKDYVPKGRHVAIIEAGGTARAAIYAAKGIGAKKISVTNRTIEKVDFWRTKGFSSFDIVDPFDFLISCVPGTVDIKLPEKTLEGLKCYLDACEKL
jgi:shikimate 5-dehydrogenase